MSRLVRNNKKFFFLLVSVTVILVFLKHHEDSSASFNTVLQQAQDLQGESERAVLTNPAVSFPKEVSVDPELSLFQSASPLSSVGIWLDLPNAFLEDGVEGGWRLCLQ